MGRHPCYRTGTRDATASGPRRSDDAIALTTLGAPTTAMRPCHRNPSTCKLMSKMVVGTERPRPSAAVPARLILRLSSNSLQGANLSCVPRWGHKEESERPQFRKKGAG